MRQLLDASAMHKAISCCGLPNVAIGAYQPRGPLGGCVGGTWQAFLSEW